MKPLPFELLVITDWSLPDCLERVKDALRAGPGIAVQHRHPGATDRLFFEEGLRLREACGDVPLFVNGRLDVALALDAHLHLTERSLIEADVRPHLPGKLISAACHPDPPVLSERSPRVPVLSERSRGPLRQPVMRAPSTPLGENGVERGVNGGADLLLVSPVFKPNSKKDEREPLGPSGFHAFADGSTVPCFALGGITAERVSALKPLAGVAVIGEVMHAASPAHAAEALLRALR